ncbi:hypothetical protein GX48_03573 [Paracoccidioides brasiliensis]|nr:hypothetical protein GX48_03573 [Paracoccidioides brasiliensis]
MFSQWTCLWKPSKPTKESRRAWKKIVEELTPDEYRARDTVRLARFQVSGKKYANATISAINRVQRFWDRHCSFMGVDAHSHLSACSMIWVEWKFLQLLFKRETGQKVDELFILGPLTDEYDLDLSINYKPVNSLLMLFIAYTSTRPRALIESGCLHGSNDALCYKDIVLRVIPNPDQPDWHVLVMEVSLMFMKGKQNKSQLLHLKWKPHMLNIPVFRRAVHAAEGIQISPDKALPYDTFNQYLQRLGRNAGFEHKLTPYCIRRGTANVVDTVATTSECNQVMGHSRADIFEHYYISAVGRFSLTHDPHAPKELSNEQKEAIKWDPQFIKLCDWQRSLHKLIERKHSSVLKSKDTALHREYTELGDTIRAKKQNLHREVFEEMRQEFFTTIDTIKIKRQLLGLPVSEGFKVDDEDKIQFTVEPKTNTSFTSAGFKQSRIGFHSAAYARSRTSGESHLPTLGLILRSTASLTLTPFPSYVQVLSVSSISEIASCHTPRGCTPFHNLTTFEDMSKIATSATLTPMLCSGVLTRRARMCWMAFKIFRGTRSWSTAFTRD